MQLSKYAFVKIYIVQWHPPLSNGSFNAGDTCAAQCSVCVYATATTAVTSEREIEIVIDASSHHNQRKVYTIFYTVGKSMVFTHMMKMMMMTMLRVSCAFIKLPPVDAKINCRNTCIPSSLFVGLKCILYGTWWIKTKYLWRRLEGIFTKCSVSYVSIFNVRIFHGISALAALDGCNMTMYFFSFSSLSSSSSSSSRFIFLHFFLLRFHSWNDCSTKMIAYSVCVCVWQSRPITSFNHKHWQWIHAS